MKKGNLICQSIVLLAFIGNAFAQGSSESSSSLSTSSSSSSSSVSSSLSSSSSSISSSSSSSSVPGSGGNSLNNVGKKIRGVRLSRGYFLTRFSSRLNFPTAVTFSGRKTWVAEAGLSPAFPPTIKEIKRNGRQSTILTSSNLPSGVLEGPLTDITFNNGRLWITHRQVGANGWLVGAISNFDPLNPAGTFTTVLTNLPSTGDHYTNEIIFDSSGRAYFSQGSATNSGVVGPDNALVTQWLPLAPTFHDFMPKDVTVSGVTFATQQALAPASTEPAVTRPFSPFNTGQTALSSFVVTAATPASPQEGIIAGNAAVYSFDPLSPTAASTLRLEAWGLRNPYGIGIDPENPTRLFVSNNGADIRGVAGENSGVGPISTVEGRPIGSDYDDMYVFDIGGSEEFFGWPDFYHDPVSKAALPVTDPTFCKTESTVVPTIPCPNFVLEDAFRATLTTQPAFAQLELHSSANKFDFSRSRRFGFKGDLFVAETGAFVPVSGASQFAGYRVVRIDKETGNVSDFVVNRGANAEALFRRGKLNKPIDVKMKGSVMMVVDFGVFEPGLSLQEPETGKVWIVTKGVGDARRFLRRRNSQQDQNRE